MSGPVRLQLSRAKGFRIRDLSIATNGLLVVRVTRPGPWGNYAASRLGLLRGAAAVEAFRSWVETEASPAWKGEAERRLRNHNLGCWCPIGQPCHADVLLEIANGPRCEAVS